jgi:hypothetical protein
MVRNILIGTYTYTGANSPGAEWREMTFGPAAPSIHQRHPAASGSHTSFSPCPFSITAARIAYAPDFARLGRNQPMMITMLLDALWHGASWNFVISGGYHGALPSAEASWV